MKQVKWETTFYCLDFLLTGEPECDYSLNRRFASNFFWGGLKKQGADRRGERAKKSFLRAKKSFSRAKKSFSRAGKSFSRTGKSFLGAGKSFLRAGKSFSRAKKSFSRAGKSFLCAQKRFFWRREGFILPGEKYVRPCKKFLLVGALMRMVPTKQKMPRLKPLGLIIASVSTNIARLRRFDLSGPLASFRAHQHPFSRIAAGRCFYKHCTPTAFWTLQPLASFPAQQHPFPHIDIFSADQHLRGFYSKISRMEIYGFRYLPSQSNTFLYQNSEFCGF